MDFIINRKDVGNRIKILLDKKKMKQKELAKEILMDESLLSKHINGKSSSDISTSSIAKIALTLDTSIDYLLFGNESRLEQSYNEVKANNLINYLIKLYQIGSIDIKNEMISMKESIKIAFKPEYENILINLLK